MLTPAEEAALRFRAQAVEVLRQLNRSEMQGVDVPGLEAEELRALLARARFPLISRAETIRVLDVLVRNRLAEEQHDEQYAWSRGRTISDRFTITTEGKSFLIRSVQRIGRV